MGYGQLIILEYELVIKNYINVTASGSVGYSFIFFQKVQLLSKYGRAFFSFFSKTCYLEKYTVVGCKVCGYVWVHA